MLLRPCTEYGQHLFQGKLKLIVECTTKPLSKTPSTPFRVAPIRFITYRRGHSSATDSMDLKRVVKALNKFAPSSLAGSWDNVGLLVEPTAPHQVASVLLTNDLTEKVMQEALTRKVDMILSYHPPIFSPLKRLTQRTWKERVIIQCIENRIAVYSPHTSFDAVVGGVNEWLLKPFVGQARPVEKVTAPQYPTAGGYKVEFTLPVGLSVALQEDLASVSTLPGVTVQGHINLGEGEEASARRVCLNCTEEGLTRVVDFVSRFEDVKSTVEILQLLKPPVPNAGPGRTVKLDSPMTLQAAVDAIKSHLNLPRVRLALATDATMDSKVRTVAVCAGSGGSVLRGVCADLYLTGEMSHHEVLDATHRGASVVLCDHSNTERGFLREFKQELESRLEKKVAVHMSETDTDPLDIV